jgi:hypothetical protein
MHYFLPFFLFADRARALGLPKMGNSGQSKLAQVVKKKSALSHSCSSLIDIRSVVIK